MKDKCKHGIVKCLCCGEEGTPAHLLASRPRVRGEKAKEQSREAGKLGGKPKRKARTAE